nr:unnamed protein product [Callosobruchus chinensis]
MKSFIFLFLTLQSHKGQSGPGQFERSEYCVLTRRK